MNVDIRGFSSFFSDSSQAAAFLGSAYTTILDDYFTDVSFFKPTGDGLLIVKAVDAQSGQTALREIVDQSLRLDEDFGHICMNDWLINFATPTHVGIGIARSTATRLADGEKTLDYSGYPLNLASRLMDLARPHGVLFDASLGPELLDAEVLSKFTQESVYIRGLADVEPLTVYRTEPVDIPVVNRTPFGAELFRERRVAKTLANLTNQGPRFVHELQHVPQSVSAITVEVEWPAANTRGGKADHHHKVTIPRHAWTYETEYDRPRVVINYGLLGEHLVTQGCKTTWEVAFDIYYPVPIGTVARSAPMQPHAPVPLE